MKNKKKDFHTQKKDEKEKEKVDDQRTKEERQEKKRTDCFVFLKLLNKPC
jgi:hypothetical protein